MGRSNHRWKPLLCSSPSEGLRASRCRDCGLVEREGWFLVEGNVLMVLQWYAPSGELLGIRAVPHANAPSTAAPSHETFPGAPVISTPPCPNTLRSATSAVVTTTPTSMPGPRRR
jgi:hypothetical protein